jgi:hypothetical protein
MPIKEDEHLQSHWNYPRIPWWEKQGLGKITALQGKDLFKQIFRIASFCKIGHGLAEANKRDREVPAFPLPGLTLKRFCKDV